MKIEEGIKRIPVVGGPGINSDKQIETLLTHFVGDRVAQKLKIITIKETGEMRYYKEGSYQTLPEELFLAEVALIRKEIRNEQLATGHLHEGFKKYLLEHLPRISEDDPRIKNPVE